MKPENKLNTLNILIIEDDEHFYNLISAIFLKINQHTEKQYALSWINGCIFDVTILNDYDAILLDYSLDECTGMNILEKAVENNCKKPIIFLTGKSNRDFFRDAKRKGAAGYLLKQEITKAPFALESVITFAMENTHQKNKLEHMALYDQLTGLPQRNLFFDRLNLAISMAHRNKVLAALLYIDLDGFKPVNDTYGHNAGDFVLIETAKRLSTSIRAVDTAARLGGDEFAIILQVNDKKNIEMIAQKVINEISKPILLTDQYCTVGASIGISIYPCDADSSAELIKNADSVMYEVKKNNKNSFMFWQNSL